MIVMQRIDPSRPVAPGRPLSFDRDAGRREAVLSIRRAWLVESPVADEGLSPTMIKVLEIRARNPVDVAIGRPRRTELKKKLKRRGRLFAAKPSALDRSGAPNSAHSAATAQW
jgi:hypothetical protein